MTIQKERLTSSLEFLTETEKHINEVLKVSGSNNKLFTLAEWKRYFYINIPEDITYQTIIDLGREIAIKYQEASYYRDLSTVTTSIIEQDMTIQYNNAYQAARIENETKFSKPLAADSCKIAATIAIKDIDDPLNVQKVIRDFWVKTCNTLVEVRKQVEILGYALAGDSRTNRDFVIKGAE
jgi:hypothetical protein